MICMWFIITWNHKHLKKSAHILSYLEMIIDFYYYYNTAVELKRMENTIIKQTNQITKKLTLLSVELLICFLIFYTYKYLQSRSVLLPFSYFNEDMFYNEGLIFHYNSYDMFLSRIYIQGNNFCQNSKETDLMKYYDYLEIIP